MCRSTDHIATTDQHTMEGHGLNFKPCQRTGTGRTLLEVFSIQFLDCTIPVTRFSGIYGSVMLQTLTMSYMLSKRNIDYPENIDQDGFIKLIGPECGIEANDHDVVIVPFLFQLVLAAFVSEPRHDIWKAAMKEDHNLYDQLMFSRIKTVLGTMEISYAICKDAAEAHLDVSVIDWEGEKVEIYGTIGARNSKITDLKARSLLFDTNEEDAVIVRPGKVITRLPLSRKVTVLSLESVLIIDVCLLNRGAIFAQGTMRCPARLTGDEELILVCNSGKIKVTVTWLKQQAHNEVVDQSVKRSHISPAC